jgi:predicted NUDIX family phosphoesterase
MMVRSFCRPEPAETALSGRLPTLPAMEFVFVIPRERLFPNCYPQGFQAFGEACRLEAFEETVLAHGFFVEREHAERNPAWKQVIPYTVVRRADGDILVMRRLKKGGEGRLHGKLSIGVGGHINPEDAASSEHANPLVGGTWRELAEELVLEGRSELEPLGLINDDSNPVGAVHVGLAQMLTIEGSVRIREDEILEGELLAPDRLAALRDEGADFETWSSILIDHLDERISTIKLSVS